MSRRLYSEYSASSVKTTTAGTALSAIKNISLFEIVTFAINVTAQSGTTLDAWIQTTYDGGTTWVDIAAATQLGSATGLLILGHNPNGAAAPAGFTATDGSLAAGTNKVVGWGDQLRLKYKITGTSYTFSVSASLQ